MKFKVGDKVSLGHNNRGEVLFINDRPGVVFPYLIGMKGLIGGHNGENRNCEKLVKEKGYEDQCLWVEEDSLEKQDMVNHPSHYNQGKREVIEEMRLMFGDKEVKSFCKLNAYKYMRRAEYKGNKEQDLKKAEWYVDYLEKMSKEN